MRLPPPQLPGIFLLLPLVLPMVVTTRPTTTPLLAGGPDASLNVLRSTYRQLHIEQSTKALARCSENARTFAA